MFYHSAKFFKPYVSENSSWWNGLQKWVHVNKMQLFITEYIAFDFEVANSIAQLYNILSCTIFFFLHLGFLSRTFTIHRSAGKGEAISLIPLYHFLPLHSHLDSGRAITAESSPQPDSNREPLVSKHKSLIYSSSFIRK